MGWGYKKRKIFGARYAHISINATQKGFTSWGVKLGPISWNSRTKAVRFDGPGGLYWQQKKSRESRGGRGKSTGGSSSGRKAPGESRQQQPIRGGPVGWGARWVRRGGRWTLMQAADRSAGYTQRVTGPAHRFLDDRREFGRVPLVRDLTTGEAEAAAHVTLPWHDSVFGPRDANMRALVEQMRRDEEKRLALAARPLRLSWLERLAIRLRGEDPTEWAARWHATDVAVMARRSERLAAAGDALPIVEAGTPARRIDRAAAARKRRENYLARVVDLDAATGGAERKEPAVANAVRTFADLYDPDIDPKEFPEELPMHLGEVRALIASRAEELQGEADRLRGEAEAMTAYADYMEAAEADRDMIASLRESVDAMESAATAWAQAAESVESAGDGVGAARARAEAAYGDWDVPDFGRAG